MRKWNGTANGGSKLASWTNNLCSSALAVGLVLSTGCATFNKNDREDAEAGKRPKADSEIVESLTMVARKAYDQGRYDIAEKEYQTLIELDPKNARALYRLGNINFRNKKFDRAIEFYARSIDVNPYMSKAHHNMSVAYLVQARKHFQFYMAMKDPAVDTSSIEKMIAQIDAFANNQSSYQSQDASQNNN